MFRPRPALALLIGIAAIVPGAAYAAPTTPAPNSEPSVSATQTPPTATGFLMALVAQPTHAFDPAEIRVHKLNGTVYVVTTDYGYRQRVTTVTEDTNGERPALMMTDTVFVAPPKAGWKAGRDYTVTATPESGPARRVTIRMDGEGTERDQRVTLTKPANPTAPLRVRLDGVHQGLPVTISVLDAANPGAGFAYITTMTTSSTNEWSIRSGDAVQVDAADYQRWHVGRVYLVRVELGPEPDVYTWQRTFQISTAPDETRPPKPTQPPTPADGRPEDRGGLAKTGW